MTQKIEIFGQKSAHFDGFRMSLLNIFVVDLKVDQELFTNLAWLDTLKCIE